MSNKVAQFFKEVKIELKKVSWPTFKQVLNSTAVVLVTVGLVGMFLWMVDLGLQQVISVIIR